MRNHRDFRQVVNSSRTILNMLHFTIDNIFPLHYISHQGRAFWHNKDAPYLWSGDLVATNHVTQTTKILIYEFFKSVQNLQILSLKTHVLGDLLYYTPLQDLEKAVAGACHTLSLSRIKEIATHDVTSLMMYVLDWDPSWLALVLVMVVF